MLTHNRLYPHLSYQVITDIAQLIDNHLRDDWVIRIEYIEEVEFLNTNWQQWGKPHYKEVVSSVVIDDIFSCHVNNPVCAIRLYAEKFNPRRKLYYSVCQSCELTKQTQAISSKEDNNQ